MAKYIDQRKPRNINTRLVITFSMIISGSIGLIFTGHLACALTLLAGICYFFVMMALEYGEIHKTK